jgi:magnesium transporter
MIVAYTSQITLEKHFIDADNQELLQDAIWIDMLNPIKVEEELVEKYTKLNVPTREEMREIEFSSRLYRDKGNLFMTAVMIANSESPNPSFDAVTFVVSPKQLITIRYIEPQGFKLFEAQLKKLDLAQQNVIAIFIELLEANIDRLADIIELVGHRLDDYSKAIFHPLTEEDGTHKLDYRQLMQQAGANGDLNSKARESLVAFNRLTVFFVQVAGTRIDDEGQVRLTSLSKDIASLNDHATFLSTKINFLLDATLGLVNIDQNNIIKIFSVAAVIFLPPTLIASMYGMNFHNMPELSWRWGYFMAVCMMVISSWLPYKYFKSKKWL